MSTQIVRLVAITAFLIAFVVSPGTALTCWALEFALVVLVGKAQRTILIIM